MSPKKKPHPTPSLAAVFARLRDDIVAGVYPQGARLPAERDLALRLHASRPTLREALRRLGEWGLVEARRGSGVTVRDHRDWSLPVLPAYLRLGAPARGPQALAAMARDLLALRRALFIDVLRIVGDRIPAGALAPARAAAEHAWTLRDDVGAFTRADYEIVRQVILAAGFLPALWLMNGFGAVYFDIATALSGAAHLPESYLASHRRVFDALEGHDATTACAVMAAYLDEHDRKLLTAMGVSP